MSQQIPLVRLARVISVDDSSDGDRIKVKLLPEDNGTNEIEYALPFLPKMIHIKPKVNECVYVLTAIANDGNTQRFYVGPVISQPTHMDYEPYFLNATSLSKGSSVTPDTAPSMDPKVKPVIPKNDDVNIEGRKNANIQITDNDVRLKAGVKVCNPINTREIEFNEKNPAYVKIKYHDKDQVTKDDKEYRSSINIVADKINLIGNDTSDNFKLTDKDELISDDEIKKIIEKAHQLPYGDILLEFLELMKKALISHTHPYVGMPPCLDSSIANVMSYDTNKILSDTVRIN